MSDMNGKICLVLGGAKGIGLAIAARLVGDGAIVFITSRNKDDVDMAVSNIGKNVHGVVLDPSRIDDLESVVSDIQKKHRKIDALILNAGVSEPLALDDFSLQHFDHHFTTNVRNHVFALKASLPAMERGGAVVLIGSIAGQAGVPNYSAYAATKASLRSFARSWAAELAPQGIRVNVVSPGPTETSMFASVPEEVKASIISTIPLGRMAHPREVASAAKFLLSNDASFITGTELCVDGGAKQV
ncbi:SDR family NAD(P)-dependent oxidoreductase [Hyphococcus sp. DH-69]|uniref:SDR family NAD(P)-dependent oxidoreductase n=1 Tax=Hyphococcus formosus TaxID=3143534 RepID=UPI00398A924C